MIMKNNKALLFTAYLAMLSIVLLGSKCKKDPDPPDPDPPKTYTCTSNITDGCFDDWKLTKDAYVYANPMMGNLQSLNKLAGLPPEAGGPGPVTCDTVTDCVQGTYAAMLTSKSFTVNSTVIFIPGYIGTSDLDILHQTIHLGKPYTLKPQTLHASYKYAPAGGDSAVIQVLLSKFNTGLGKRDTIAFNKIIVKNPVSSYTQLDLPISYSDTISTPDTLIVVFSASAGVKFNDLFHCTGQVGSAMWVDDLRFVFP
jgi:hypothetical protein